MKHKTRGFETKKGNNFYKFLRQQGIWNKKTIKGDNFFIKQLQPVHEGEHAYLNSLLSTSLFLNIEDYEMANDIFEMCREIEIDIKKIISEKLISKEEIVFKSVKFRHLIEKMFYSAILTIHPSSFREYEAAIKDSLLIHKENNNKRKNPLNWLSKFNITSIYGVFKYVKQKYKIDDLIIKNITMFYDSVSSVIHNFSDFEIKPLRLMSLLYFGRTTILNVVKYTSRPYLIGYYQENLQSCIDISQDNFKYIDPAPRISISKENFKNLGGYVISEGNFTRIGEGTLDLGVSDLKIDDSFFVKFIGKFSPEEFVEYSVNSFHSKKDLKIVWGSKDKKPLK